MGRWRVAGQTATHGALAAHSRSMRDPGAISESTCMGSTSNLGLVAGGSWRDGGGIEAGERGGRAAVKRLRSSTHAVHAPWTKMAHDRSSRKPEQWNLSEELTQVLGPFKRATEFLSGEQYVTLCSSTAGAKPQEVNTEFSI